MVDEIGDGQLNHLRYFQDLFVVESILPLAAESNDDLSLPISQLLGVLRSEHLQHLGCRQLTSMHPFPPQILLIRKRRMLSTMLLRMSLIHQRLFHYN
jgi:hypothetical protein